MKLLTAILMIIIAMLFVIMSQRSQIKELQQANDAALQTQKEMALENEQLVARLDQLETKIAELEEKVASVNNFVGVAEAMIEVEDMAQEAITHAQEVTDSAYMYYNGVGTNIEYVDYVLDIENQKIVRTIKNPRQELVVYISNERAIADLEKALWGQYYSGLENYVKAVNNCEGVVLISHNDIK